MRTNPVTVLYVEDDDVDYWTIERQIEEGDIPCKLVRASTPEEAFDILRGENGHEALPMPRIILLDINLPGYNGIEFLRQLRSDPGLAPTVVFALSTSCSPKDIKDAHGLNVAGYFLKDTRDACCINLASFLETYVCCAQFPE